MFPTYLDADKLRYDDADRDAAATRVPGHQPRGAPCLVAKTKTISTYPATAAVYYGCETQVVLGTQTEGSAGTTNGKGNTLYALNLGTQVPPAGTAIICTLVGFRWVFRYDG